MKWFSALFLPHAAAFSALAVILLTSGPPPGSEREKQSILHGAPPRFIFKNKWSKKKISNQRDKFVSSRFPCVRHPSETVNPLGNVSGVCSVGCRVPACASVCVCLCVFGWGLTLCYVTVSSAPLKLWTVSGTCCCFTLLLDDRGYLLHSMYSVCVSVCA